MHGKRPERAFVCGVFSSGIGLDVSISYITINPANYFNTLKVINMMACNCETTKLCQRSRNRLVVGDTDDQSDDRVHMIIGSSVAQESNNPSF
jgi:hypothetical protein